MSSSMEKHGANNSQKLRSHRPELIAAGLFVVVNLIVPLTAGEIYPFTTSPMFRDQPETYCVYLVFDVNGDDVPLDEVGLQMVYDGNPPGLGVGIVPPQTLHEFGEVPTPDEIIAYVKTYLEKHERLYEVNVNQTIYHRMEGGNRLWHTEKLIKVSLEEE